MRRLQLDFDPTVLNLELENTPESQVIHGRRVLAAIDEHIANYRQVYIVTHQVGVGGIFLRSPLRFSSIRQGGYALVVLRNNCLLPDVHRSRGLSFHNMER
jgi:hypothetical protein